MEAVVGAVLLVIGAVGATVTTQQLERSGRGRIAPLAVAPMGVLIGAGAALIRGWDLLGSMLVGAVLVPVVGAAVQLLELRRRRRR